MLLAGCAGLRRGHPGPTDVALYRGRVSLRGDDPRSFQLLLYAARPDRLHAEVLGPMGGAHLVVDAGGGRLAVGLPGEGVAYVGEAGPEAFRRVLGVPLSLEPFVRFLTDGAVPATEGLTASREPAGPGLPRRLEVLSEGASLLLTRRQWRPSPPDPGALGTGTAAPGLRVLPLEEMPDLEAAAR